MTLNMGFANFNLERPSIPLIRKVISKFGSSAGTNDRYNRILDHKERTASTALAENIKDIDVSALELKERTASTALAENIKDIDVSALELKERTASTALAENIKDIDVSENISTIDENLQAKLSVQLVNVLNSAKYEVFENGVETTFSNNIVNLVKQYGRRITDILSNLALQEDKFAAAIDEALTWIGEMDDPNTYVARRDLLLRALSAKSALIRDGALAGLMYFDDVDILPALQHALDAESVPTLRNDLENMIRFLRSE